MASESFTLDVRQLRAAARMFREQIPKDIRNAMNRDIRKIGRVVADEAISAARFNIDRKAVSVRTNGPRVVIAVKATEAKPHHGEALAFENAGNEGSFRHPVYGNRSAWVDQAARPFLTPTAELRYEWVVQQIGDIADRAMRAAGFH